MKLARIIGIVHAAGIALAACAADRPEMRAFPYKTGVTAGGEYENGGTVGTDYVVSGSISSSLTFSSDVPCRVTLDGAVLSAPLALDGDFTLWLKGASSIAVTNATAIFSDGSLTIGGPGSLALSSMPVSKQSGPIVADDLVLAGGNVSAALNADVKNACGVCLAGDYTQLAGALSIDCASFGATNKVNGILLNKKNKTVTVSGGRLAVAVSGEKSVGVSLDKSGTSMTLSGGTVELSVAGGGAKGVKGDGTFTMTGGMLNASVTGGCLYEENLAGEGTNYVVNVSSTTYFSSTGSYVVQDTSPAYAVKCGSISISGGTVRVEASGVASRGLCADGDDGAFDIAGGFFDITCSGASSDTVLCLLDETALTTEIDKATASCLRTSGTNSTFTITGGTLNLVASGTGGKCIVAKGDMTIGTSGQTTLPTDSAFHPDIQAATYGTQAYVARAKQSSYKSIGTATASTATSLKYAKNYIVSGSGENADYTNPKCIKAEGNLTMHGGRIRGFSQAEGGEGFESKNILTINGGLFEATTYDDCINASYQVVINGGYLYCGSTNNDVIDSNGSHANSIVVNGGIVLAFTAMTPEIGIDTDYSSGLKINGGTVVSFGSNAGNMLVKSSGSLATYAGTVASSSYAGKYLKMTGGTRTVYVKVPALSSSQTLSLVCTTDGCTSAPSISAASSAAGTSQEFHGVYFQSATLAAGPGGGQPGGGGNTPGGGGNQPGGGGSAAFTFDTFLAATSTNSTKCLVREGLWTGWASGVTAATLGSSISGMVAGVCSGCPTLSSLDLSDAAISEIPDGAFAGCTNLVTVTLPSSCTKIGANAFAGCSRLSSLTANGVAAVGDDAFRACSALTATPPAVTAAGAFSFAGSGVAAVSLDGMTAVGEGAFAGCESLKTATAGAALPAALFAGCISLAFDPSGCTSIGQAALAGVPYSALVLPSAATIGEYAFAADAATAETTLTFDGATVPHYDATAFLGRSLAASYAPVAGSVARVEAMALVTWLQKQAADSSSAFAQPASYNTADLEAWLDDPSNIGAAFAFCWAKRYAADAAFRPLVVDGKTFIYTAPDGGTADSLTVTVVGTNDLTAETGFAAEALVVVDTADGVTAYESADASAPACFARLRISKSWK